MSNKRAMRDHRCFQRNKSPFVTLKASLRAFGHVDRNTIARASCLASVASLRLFQHVSVPGVLCGVVSWRVIGGWVLVVEAGLRGWLGAGWVMWCGGDVDGLECLLFWCWVVGY